MKASKKVTFIENVAKTELGLEGLEIVVECDRNCRGDQKEKIEFGKIGRKMLKEIDGEYIKSKYNLSPGIELRNKMHQERVEWMKKNVIS
ncbi:MAG: hypothetical protein HFJ20_02295 [Clostridia bacterium]|nr:hypothetical protein [Clostridia bacterium]